MLDGAGWWAKLRYVVFPFLRGPVSLGLVIAFLHNVNSFTLPFVLFGAPSPRDVTVLPVLTYTESFQNSAFGLSAAMAVISLLLIAIPLVVYLRAVRLNTPKAAFDDSAHDPVPGTGRRPAAAALAAGVDHRGPAGRGARPGGVHAGRVGELRPVGRRGRLPARRLPPGQLPPDLVHCRSWAPAW